MSMAISCILVIVLVNFTLPFLEIISGKLYAVLLTQSWQTESITRLSMLYCIVWAWNQLEDSGFCF